MANILVSQTDANSPIDETLMDAIRVNSSIAVLGDIKEHITYNGAAPIDQGYMLCDGRLISKANYDAEHGAGSWDLWIGSSPLDGKYLPDFTNKFSVGAATTPQTGASPFTSEGNASHQVNLQHNHTHTHTVNSHNHQWIDTELNYSGTADRQRTFTSGGSYQGIAGVDNADMDNSQNDPNAGNVHANSIGNGVPDADVVDDAYTSNSSPGTDSDSTNSGSTAQNIKPESIAVQKYLKII